MKGVEIPSAELGNRGVLFGGLGWYTRLEFPYLNNLNAQGTQVETRALYLRFIPSKALIRITIPCQTASTYISPMRIM